MVVSLVVMNQWVNKTKTAMLKSMIQLLPALQGL